MFIKDVNKTSFLITSYTNKAVFKLVLYCLYAVYGI